MPKTTRNVYDFGAAYDANAFNHPGVDFTNVLPGLPPSQINYDRFTPNYANLIANDAGLKAALDALNPVGIANAAQRDAGIQRGYVQAGLPLDLNNASSALGLSLGDLSNIIDPTTQQLARENTAAGLSTQARLDQAHNDAVRNIKSALAARGALHSGEAGFQLGRENQNYSQAEYDATQRLLDYMASYQQGFAQAEQQRQMALAQAASDAATRQSQLPQNMPTAGETATFDSYGPNGQPLYRGADGRLYNLDGSPVSSEQLPPPDFTGGQSTQGSFRLSPGHGGGPFARMA